MKQKWRKKLLPKPSGEANEPLTLSTLMQSISLASFEIKLMALKGCLGTIIIIQGVHLLLTIAHLCFLIKHSPLGARQCVSNTKDDRFLTCSLRCSRVARTDGIIKGFALEPSAAVGLMQSAISCHREYQIHFLIYGRCWCFLAGPAQLSRYNHKVLYFFASNSHNSYLDRTFWHCTRCSALHNVLSLDSASSSKLHLQCQRNKFCAI